jgi:hypothetical protein
MMSKDKTQAMGYPYNPQTTPNVSPYTYPTTTPHTYPSYTFPLTYTWNESMLEAYANEVEVDIREFDATLRFIRKNKGSETVVKEILVPLALLEKLKAQNPNHIAGKPERKKK